MRVTYFVQNEGGCDYYRAMLPMDTLRNHGWKVERVVAHRFLWDITTAPEKTVQKLNTDVLFIPRLQDQKYMEKMVSVARGMNPNVVVATDFDDNVFAVSPMSPHYVDYGVEPVKIKFQDGTYKTIWDDGMKFGERVVSFAENRQRLENVRTCMIRSDIVFTTTERIAQRFREITDSRVVVCPNSVSLDAWKSLPLVRDEWVRLFWSGGESHYEDWFILRNVIAEVMRRHKSVRLVLMGCMWERTLDGVPRDRVDFIDWTDRVSYGYEARIARPDIGLIPLRDTEFNRCKSPIKWIELAAQGVPSVASYIPPYKHLAALKADNGAFVANNNPNAWVKAISYLIQNEEKRRAMGQAAHDTVAENFDINKTCLLWSKAFQEVLRDNAVESHA